MTRKIIKTKFQRKSFNRQISAYFKGEIPSNENFYLGLVPKILNKHEIVGFKLVMSQKTFEKITNLEYGHHLSRKVIKKLPKFMKRPYLVLKGSLENTLVEIIGLKDYKKRDILVAIRLDAKEAYTDVTRVTSVYGKKGLINYLLSSNHIVLDVYNEKKTNRWLVNKGLQLSKFPSANDLSCTYIICEIN